MEELLKTASTVVNDPSLLTVVTTCLSSSLYCSLLRFSSSFTNGFSKVAVRTTTCEEARVKPVVIGPVVVVGTTGAVNE